MCVMELDFNLQVTHFPTGKKHQNCPQKCNSHHLTAVRQSLSADLSSAACHIGSTKGSCRRASSKMHFVPLGKAGQSPSLSSPLVLLQPLRRFGQQWWGPVWLQSCKNQTEVRFPELLCLLIIVRAEAPRTCAQGLQSNLPGFWGSPGDYLVGSVLDLGLVSFGSIRCVTQQNTWPLCLFTVTSFLWCFSNISFWFSFKTSVVFSSFCPVISLWLQPRPAYPWCQNLLAI